MNSPTESVDSPSEPPTDAPRGLVLDRIPGTFGICRLSPKARIPRWVHRSVFFSVCRSPNELSILCEDRLVPKGVSCEPGWSAVKVAGTLDFSLIGVLASLANPLAEAKIGLFTVSTFDTDYLLVREKRLEDAIRVLEAAGHTFDLRLLPSQEAQAAAPTGSAATETTEPTETTETTEATETAAVEPRVSESRPLGSRPLGSRPPESRSPAPEPAAVEVERSEPKVEKQEVKSAFARVFAERGEDPKPATDVERQTTSVAPPTPEEKAAPKIAPWAPKPAPTRESAEHKFSRDRIEPPSSPQPIAESSDDRPEAAASSVPESATAEGAAGAREADGLFTGAIPQHPVEITDKSFADLGLSAAILATVREVGFEHPTPIQAGVIPQALAGIDVIGLAETGSGKTAAFSLPLAERLTHGRGTRGLILCPTREIALQTKAFLDIFGRDHALETVSVIGGVRMGPQIDGFRRDADILVATPGRLADHMRRGNVRLDKIEKLVLDEADHMLDLGFLPQIKEILEQVPDGRQTLMFSATMPPPIERLAQIFMRDPERVDIRPIGQIATGIEHRLYLVKDEHRKDCLFGLLKEIEGSTLIFVRRKLYTEWLARQIELAGFRVARIHSDRSQSQRVEALRAFREGQVRILVATDVAARGIDVPRIQHVINYGLPEQTEDYVHRAGRTARGSAAGVVSTIGTWQDKLMVREIELDLGITLPRYEVADVEPYVELPKRKTVRRRRLL